MLRCRMGACEVSIPPLDLNTLGRMLSVRADTDGGTAGSVAFDLDGQRFSTDNAAPYAILGDSNGAYNPWTPSAGSHTLTATVYSGPGGTGESAADGSSSTISLSRVRVPYVRSELQQKSGTTAPVTTACFIAAVNSARGISSPLR